MVHVLKLKEKKFKGFQFKKDLLVASHGKESVN
jgi:hypothetical protein